MGTWSTGEMQNGWSLSLSGSRRWGNSGYVEGTFYDAWAYFLSEEKKFNNSEIVDGFIFNKVKCGFVVDLQGTAAFLPGSQVDTKIIKDIDPLMGKRQPF